jgi:hypothetical protein
MNTVWMLDGYEYELLREYKYGYCSNMSFFEQKWYICTTTTYFLLTDLVLSCANIRTGTEKIAPSKKDSKNSLNMHSNKTSINLVLFNRCM